MAEVSFLHLCEPLDDFDFEQELQEELSLFDSFSPYYSHVFHPNPDSIPLTDNHSADLFPAPYDQTGPEFFERENQVTYLMDLIHHRGEQSVSVEVESGLIERNIDEIGGDSLELEELGFAVSDSLEEILHHAQQSIEQNSEEIGGDSMELGEDLGLVEEFGFMDLNHHRAEQSVSVIERNSEEIGGDSLELEMGEALGLDTEFDRIQELGYRDEEEDDNFGGFMVSDGGHEFYVSRGGGLNVVSFESDSEEEVGQLLETVRQLQEDYASASRMNEDENFVMCWNRPNLEEDHRDGTDDFEWEEVHNGLESLPVPLIIHPEEDEIEETQRSRNREWEVLLDVNNLDRNFNESQYVGGELDGFIYDEVTFAQFVDAEEASMGSRPPASSRVIQNLPLVTIKESDLQNGNALCAVCKDEMGIGEQVKQLPCSHRYHGDCITPWLEISNTCPVCRHELPTDDPDYELRQMERAAREL